MGRTSGRACLDASGCCRSAGPGRPGSRVGASICCAIRTGRRLGAPGDAARSARPFQPGFDHVGRAGRRRGRCAIDRRARCFGTCRGAGRAAPALGGSGARACP